MRSSSETSSTPDFLEPRQILRRSGNVQHIAGPSSFSLSNEGSSINAVVVLDYSRCVGGFPVFTATSASASQGQQHVTFQVTYSETIEGIDNENGMMIHLILSSVLLLMVARQAMVRFSFSRMPWTVTGSAVLTPPPRRIPRR